MKFCPSSRPAYFDCIYNYLKLSEFSIEGFAIDITGFSGEDKTYTRSGISLFDPPTQSRADIREKADFESAQRMEFMHRGEKLAAWSWGEGLTVFLLHGWESHSGHLNAFVPSLLDAGFQVLAFDAPCHGQSEGSVTDAVDYGRAVQSAVEAFGAPVAMIGHSVGSAAALYAFSHGVTLRASVHIAGPSSMERVLRRGANAAGLDEAGAQHVLHKMATQICEPLAVMDLEQLQPGFRHPALILHDPDDREMPYTESVALAQAWSGSKLESIAGVGHRRIIRTQSVVETSVQFIVDAL